MSQTDTTTYPWKGGTIKSIKLVNFMCHDSFELELGPKVNFIIGPNGSGKSALLTALVVALGGRATVTSRAKKMSDFVMYGKNFARISVLIHNFDKIMHRDQAFKPDDYGKTITVEKTIFKDEVSKLVMKNDKDKKISERASELHEMLNHFNILINNPICILNQEVSKTFLHSKRGEDKFALFMKATNLEQIEEDYDSAHDNHRLWDETNVRKEAAFKMLDHEYNACKEKSTFLTNRAKLNDTLEKLNKELLWALLRDTEESNEELTQKVRLLDDSIAESNRIIESSTKKVKTAEEDIQVSRDKIKTFQEKFDKTKRDLDAIRSKEMHLKTKRIEVRGKIDHCLRTLKRHENDKASIEKSITDLKSQFRNQNALDQSNEQRKLEIERLERDLKKYQEMEKQRRLLTDQLSSSMVTTRTELNQANVRVNQIKSKIAYSESTLGRLKNGRGNAIRRFGDTVIKLREEIDKAHDQGTFIRKPIGPLGFYIRLKTPDVAEPLEVHLGRNANAFACDNQKDRSALTTICKNLSRAYREFRMPVIITRPFVSRFDVRRHKANHDQYKTLLDHLDIEEDAVYNALVDRTSLECVLYIPNYSRAESLMIDSERVPKNTRCAYTKDINNHVAVMHPNTKERGYKAITHSHFAASLFTDNTAARIKEVEREIEVSNADLRSAEFNAKQIQNNLIEHRKEYDSCYKEVKELLTTIRENEEKLLNLRTMVIQEPQELSALESELEKIEVQSEKEKLNLDSYREALEKLESELTGVSKERAVCQDVQRKNEEDRNSVHKIIEQTKNIILEHEGKLRVAKTTLQLKKDDKTELSKRLEENLEKLARSNQQLNESDRPRKIRATKEIKEERKKIETQIRVDQEDNRDPEEQLESLRKRMEEIENLSILKKLNEDNYNLAKTSLNDRKIGFAGLRSNTVGAVAATFSTVMRTMKMNGRIEIYLEDYIQDGEVVKKAKTLEMQIDTHYAPTQRAAVPMNDSNNNSEDLARRSLSQPAPTRAKRARRDPAGGDSIVNEKENDMKMTDARSLSGGERSFSTVAFVLALWHHCSSPFKLMDEIDVFMDMVTRRVSYNALITFAKVTEDSGQFIFFSPLELPKFDNSGSFVRVFEMPAIIRKGASGTQLPIEEDPS